MHLIFLENTLSLGITKIIIIRYSRAIVWLSFDFQGNKAWCAYAKTPLVST